MSLRETGYQVRYFNWDYPTSRWGVRGSKPDRWNTCSPFQNVQTGTGSHPTSYSINTGILSRVKAEGAHIYVVPLHLASRLRMSGDLPLLSPHVFILWTGTNLLLIFLDSLITSGDILRTSLFRMSFWRAQDGIYRYPLKTVQQLKQM